jgi:hypothetical protein
MKKLTLIVFLIVSAVLESFYDKTPVEKNNENKVGVWKTYEDFKNGNLTDLGSVTENPNAWRDFGVFFEKEHIMPSTTKYWGMRRPYWDYKKNSFVNHAIPVPNTSTPIHFYKGGRWQIMINPMPIGIYYLTGEVRYTADGNLQATSAVSVIAAKGDGEAVQTNGMSVSTEEGNAIRAFFDDDPDIQKAFDAEYSKARGGSKHLVVLAKYAVLYNKKHTPGYVSRLKEYIKTK